MKIAAILGAFPAAALANNNFQGAAGVEPSSPYDLINPKIFEDAKIVRLLFAYECNFCRQYHSGISEWGKTLPAGWRFLSTPILTSPNESLMLAVFGRKILEGVSPAHLSVYDMMMFERIQEDSTPMKPEEMLKIIISTGADGKALKEAIEGGKIQEIEGEIHQHASIIEKYGVTATPTVAIGGRFRVTPDHANGDPQKFAMLLNGIVSRVIDGGKHE